MDKPSFTKTEYQKDEQFDHAVRVSEDRRDNSIRWSTLPVVGQNVVDVTSGETLAFRQESYILDMNRHPVGIILHPAMRGDGRGQRG
jgi:hypothetical protein